MSARALQANWMAASSFCKNNGMTMATLETADELNYFLGRCVANIKLIDWGLILIGGIAPINNVKQGYVWFPTGEKVGYPIPWAPTEPNNNGKIENCLSAAYGSDKKFGIADVSCTAQVSMFQFVCQESTLKGKGNVAASSD